MVKDWEIFKYYWLSLDSIYSYGDEEPLDLINSKFSTDLNWEKLMKILFFKHFITKNYRDIVYNSKLYTLVFPPAP